MFAWGMAASSSDAMAAGSQGAAAFTWVKAASKTSLHPVGKGLARTASRYRRARGSTPVLTTAARQLEKLPKLLPFVGRPAHAGPFPLVAKRPSCVNQPALAIDHES
jgi:hypothetical protein